MTQCACTASLASSESAEPVPQDSSNSLHSHRPTTFPDARSYVVIEADMQACRGTDAEATLRQLQAAEPLPMLYIMLHHIDGPGARLLGSATRCLQWCCFQALHVQCLIQPQQAVIPQTNPATIILQNGFPTFSGSKTIKPVPGAAIRCMHIPYEPGCSQ